MSTLPTSSGTVATDRPCLKCGYSLLGLKYGSRCPECGHPISRPRMGGGRFTDALADAPIAYLKPLAVGLLLMATSGVGTAASLGLVRGGHELHGAIWAVVLAGAWWCGVWIVTRRRPIGDHTIHDPLLDSPRLRLAVRVTQLAWLAAAAGWLMVAAAPIINPPPARIPGTVAVVAPLQPLEYVGRRLALFFEPIGFLAIVPLSILLSSLADWAGDSAVADRFRMSAWGIAVGGTLGILGLLGAGSPGTLMGIIGVLGMITLAGAVLATVIFVISLVQLAGEAVWAISNAHNRQAVEERMARRRAAEERKLDLSHARSEAARLKGRAKGRGSREPSATPRPPPGPAGEPTIARPSGGAEPYALEPDEPEH